MTLHLLTPSRTSILAFCGFAIAAGIFVAPARADIWNKRTVLTVNETTQVSDAVLQPGQYVLKLLDSPSERHVVQIFNGDQTHIIDTVLAIPTERLTPTGKSVFTFYETPPGAAHALRKWYYPGDSFGQEFPYPKHLAMLTASTGAVRYSAMAPPAPASEPAAPAPAPSAEPQQAEQPSEPNEVAQNTPPPATPEQTPAQSTPEQPASLPKTGSFYPAIGVLGIMLIGFAGLIRLKRRA